MRGCAKGASIALTCAFVKVVLCSANVRRRRAGYWRCRSRFAVFRQLTSPMA
ncbi:hypothetical protein GLA29479_3133 [Lysobacter antibioticus]|uniref:Uncharacterized protein n=1 Tax=Lysobacter antibioticus TaxID=84531 RepID=A0A0S2DZH2_LYSAN|nr:hypothetical protein GLA29479_3133 [Lysobacter antibioticus]ALN79107.1 hypothetical protein LA76x_0946 [Lysobacter antibioticus]